MRTLSLLLVGLTAIVTAACSSSPSDDAASGEAGGDPVPTLSPSEPFDTDTVVLAGPDGDRVDVPVYVADEPEERAFGLMEREDLPDGAGMVFLFPEERTGAFYMYRTRIPLSIAFYGPSGEVVSTLDMDPCESEDPAQCERYDPGVPYEGALEVNQGFFDEIGLGEGWVVELPTSLPEPS